MEDLNAKAKEILLNITYLTLATVTPEGKPWNSPVFAAYDDAYVFYWNSSPEAQHSRNISRMDEAFAVIYDSANATEGQGVGLYMQGKAMEITDEQELLHAQEVFYARKGTDHKPLEHYLGQAPRRMYSFRPEKFWINQFRREHGFAVDEKFEIELP